MRRDREERGRKCVEMESRREWIIKGEVMGRCRLTCPEISGGSFFSLIFFFFSISWGAHALILLDTPIWEWEGALHGYK